MKPKFKKMAAENESISFVVIDAEKNPNSRQLADVSNLPTFAAFENGRLLNQVQTNKAEGTKNHLLMKLPLIKHIVQFIDEHDEDYVDESLAVLEHLCDYTGIKDEEIDVLVK